MSIKTDGIYPKYINFLESQNLSSGAFELSKISSSKFEEFKLRYENNPTFKQKIDNKYRTIEREEKITEIIEDDFDSFFN